jgi:hypothetical protein
VFAFALQMSPGGLGGLGVGIVFVLYLLVVVGLPLVVAGVGLYLLYGIRKDVGRVADAADRLVDEESSGSPASPAPSEDAGPE